MAVRTKERKGVIFVFFFAVVRFRCNVYSASRINKPRGQAAFSGTDWTGLDWTGKGKERTVKEMGGWMDG